MSSEHGAGVGHSRRGDPEGEIPINYWRNYATFYPQRTSNLRVEAAPKPLGTSSPQQVRVNYDFSVSSIGIKGLPRDLSSLSASFVSPKRGS